LITTREKEEKREEREKREGERHPEECEGA
jgi:hypothetical protein